MMDDMSHVFWSFIEYMIIYLIKISNKYKWDIFIENIFQNQHLWFKDHRNIFIENLLKIFSALFSQFFFYYDSFDNLIF